MVNAQGVEKPGVKRQQRSAEEKRRLVEETLVAGGSVSSIAKARGVNSNQLSKWRRQYQLGLLRAGSHESTLLPVRISDEVFASKSTDQAGVCTPVTIHIEFARGRMRMEGAVDLTLFGVLLEALAG